jgi:hypothetical protein
LSEIDKWSIIEFDGLTGEARLSERPLGQKLGEVLSKELLFDIWMDAADILFFRIGTDSNYDAFGWFIDDIRIYTCVAATPTHTPTSTPTTPTATPTPIPGEEYITDGGFENAQGDFSHPNWSLSGNARFTRNEGIARTGQNAAILSYTGTSQASRSTRPFSPAGFPLRLDGVPALNPASVVIQSISQLIQNGGFETDRYWTTFNTARTNAQYHSGNWSMGSTAEYDGPFLPGGRFPIRCHNRNDRVLLEEREPG